MQSRAPHSLALDQQAVIHDICGGDNPCAMGKIVEAGCITPVLAIWFICWEL
ncbi:MAG: hypothetical protein WAN58_08435 [Anaerolineales bacterium]